MSLVCTSVNVVVATNSSILMNDKMQNKTAVSNAEENVSYCYRFINNTYLSYYKIERMVYLIAGDIRQNSHGPQYSNGTSIALKLSGDSRIKIGYCGNDTLGQKGLVEAVGGTVGELPTFLKKQAYECFEKSGKMYSFDFSTILITFKDQARKPDTFEIKAQDIDLYVVPGVQDSLNINFETEMIPSFFTGSFPISSVYTIDNGIVTIGIRMGEDSLMGWERAWCGNVQSELL